MQSAVKIAQSKETCDGLNELIQDPGSFGLRENLPRRVLDLLASARRMLLEYAYDQTNMSPLETDLAVELSQDSGSTYPLRAEDKALPFHGLLCRRMEQLRLSPHDVAVSLGSTLQYVSDLRNGIKTPTEQRITELALLLAVTQETLRTAVKKHVNSRPAMVGIFQ